MIRIVHLNDAVSSGLIQPLIDASVAEGYDFVARFWDFYVSGANRFDQPGAALIGAFAALGMVGIGGIQPDPYLGDPAIGRIRHIYVLPEHRRAGTGSVLMRALIDHGAATFSVITLRTVTDHGRAFYASLGFSDGPRFAEATHWLETCRAP